MGSLRFFSQRATLAAPPNKVAAAAADAAKAEEPALEPALAPLLLLPPLHDDVLAVVRVQDAKDADPAVFRAAAALRVETAISLPCKGEIYIKSAGICVQWEREKDDVSVGKVRRVLSVKFLAASVIMNGCERQFGHIMCR